MTRFYHSFDAGVTDGTAVTTSNSSTGGTPFDTVTAGSLAALTYAAGAGARGTLCLRYTTGVTAAAAFVAWGSTSWPAGSARVYGRCTITPATVGAGATIVRARSGSVQMFLIEITAAGKIQLRNAANTVVAASAGSMAIGVDSWRLDWDVTVGTTAAGTLHIYTDPAAAVPAETLSVVNTDFGTGWANEAAFGQVTASAGVDVRLDDVMITDGFLPGPAYQARTPGDAVAAGDGAARIVARARAVGDTVAVTDTAARATLAVRQIAETVTVGDTAGRSATAGGRQAAETLTAADTAARGMAGGRQAAEALRVADTAGRVGVLRPRQVGESLTVNGTAVRVVSAAVSGGDQVALSQQAGRGPTVRARQVDEVVMLVDHLGRQSDATAFAVDMLVLAGAVARGPVGRARQVAEQAIPDGQVSRVVAMARPVAEVVLLVDVVARDGMLRPRPVVEAVALADVVSSSQQAETGAAEQITVGGQASRSTSVARDAVEAVVLAGLAGRGPGTRVRQTADAVQTVDQVVRVVSLRAAGTDFCGLADAAVRRAGFRRRDVAAAVQVADQVGRGVLARTRNVFDAAVVDQVVERGPSGAVRGEAELVRLLDRAAAAWRVRPQQGIAVASTGVPAVASTATRQTITITQTLR